MDLVIANLQDKCRKMPQGFVLTYDDASKWYANRGMNCGMSGKANKEFMAELVKRGLVKRP